MDETFSRSELLLGSCAMERLKNSRVIIFGVGGVGGYVLEALARTGVGHIDLVDSDTVSKSNINRQIIATQKTLGLLKTEVAKQRALDINPEVNINCFNIFYSSETANEISLGSYDYIVDAIDSVPSKILLIKTAKVLEIPIISSMGAGNKLNPLSFEVADIYKTSVCPLARALRTKLKAEGVKDLKVVYSKESPVKVQDNSEIKVPGSVAFVPSVVGLIIASEVIRDIINNI